MGPKKDKKKEVVEEDLNAIEEKPDWQPHLRIWCVEKKKKGEEVSKKKKKKNEDLGTDEPPECENPKCKSKKIKANEPIFAHSMVDENRKTQQEWDGFERHECVKCTMAMLITTDLDLDKIDGWGEMSEAAQNNSQKLFWKEKAKAKKKERSMSQRSQEAKEEDEPVRSAVESISLGA
mmetsp:Transcript_45808/g.60679  ORF Transcript_45808/g.60679 Transcript_45808/m.60679 type:complete len:178 (-) Transcript_45808:198-731(-)|eukprot:CAMPEP_0185571068 /NCGR_PEP_ID=MMETSP0434-20130131/3130_1 /TAXON_ID=626734 ORGANISM="Favella taraikaensis, Strain Fe Narragansett Bay" /NCGR_SAMPLE_ID=MMETSP0434 /ASSEMBLY_ACC=CAM_ASM_000379 /LENGTH=177 /DNA_ID=CAMNT_0028186313 /DNA_START=41 /DNA_END=574 /DNA_ORIENTATION=-